jgi:hypothetical protein
MRRAGRDDQISAVMTSTDDIEMQSDHDDVFTGKQASEYLERRRDIRLAPSTLANLRCAGERGPEFVYIGRWVRYRRSALDHYADSITSEPMRSTKSEREAELDAAGGMVAMDASPVAATVA